MNNVTVLFVVLIFLVGRAGGIKPNRGYCYGTQCFTVFREPLNFSAAQKQCKGQHGQLMTVRSTVSHDVLSILLENFAGEFWIGLHLPTGCPDPADKLRGFKWVNADSESDFTNWSPNFDSSCSSHRCVSVSQKDEYKWTQEPCEERVSGFLCEYKFDDACKSLPVAPGEFVNYTTPIGFFGGEDMLSLPPGSTAVRMPSETKFICFSEQWLQAPWDCAVNKGGCEYKCADDYSDTPSCYCPPGQTINPTNNVTCGVEAADDPCLTLHCEHACHRYKNSYACTCDHGFQLAEDGRSCVDFNDCTDQRQCPGENFRCVNTVGGFQCVCKDGYRMSGDLCVDEDECESAPCEHECKNTPGSYQCTCYDGFKPDPESPDRCILYCGFEECPAECDPNNKFECYCPKGYVSEERDGGDTFCLDIDECDFGYCEQTCRNTFGSYVCSCFPGFTLVSEYKCVKSEDTGDSGQSTTPKTPSASPTVPHPGPTRQPSGVTTGGLVGIIVCTVFFVVLVVFLIHYLLLRKGKMESSDALKAAESEAHGLQQVNGDG
ncbi:thrombomodulin [Parambassis ranga]|uniref:Thrombomodulin n=1 Tax=Parambassis ranga TaxID=210632 RepID=A0A6P7HGK3_9TELE|nr:thrombomodulin-like [Parambassis ranga]